MAKKRKRVRQLVPRLGPPVNLRPAGAHDDKRKRTRAEEMKAALQEAAFEHSGRARSPRLVQVAPTPGR